MKKLIEKSFGDSFELLRNFIENEKNHLLIEESVKIMTHSLKEDGKVLSCGNGGSMCDAMHFAEELTGRFCRNRKSLPAIAISDPSHLTCTANDYGYNDVFSRYIEGLGQKGDILLAISTSGNSKNIINAVEMAHKKGMKIIGLLGNQGGKLKDMVDIPLIVPHTASERIQEIHIKIIHTFIRCIEEELFPGLYL